MKLRTEDKIAGTAIVGAGCLVVVYYLLVIAALITGIVLAWKHWG